MSSSLRILLVDDEPLVLRAHLRTLSRRLPLPQENFSQAVDMASALAVFSEHGPAIGAVVTDLDMSRQGEGFDLHHHLREVLHFAGPIIINSGRLEPEDAEVLAITTRYPKTRFYAKPIMDPAGFAAWLRENL